MFSVHLLFRIFGNITALVLFLVPLITFSKIVRKKSTEAFSGVPYVITLLNCLLAAWYGLPFISPNNLPLSTVNGTGAAIEFFYVIVFLFYCKDKKYRAKILGCLVIVLMVFAIIALVSLMALKGKGRKLLCGSAATIFSMCMYASPLSVMRMVIKTKSVKYMPFFLSLFVFLCGTSWFIFGLLGRDPFIIVANGVGSGLGTIQLILYAIYKDWNSFLKRSTSESAPTSEVKEMGEKENTMEMGNADIDDSTDIYKNQKKINGSECS